MKRIYICLILLIGFFVLSGCGESDTESEASKNMVSFNGTNYNIIGAQFENVMSQGEVNSVPIDLYLNEDGSECLSVEVQREDIGKQVDLTDMNSLYRITFDYDGKHYSWFRTTDMRSAYNLQSGSKASITRMSNGKYSVSVSLSYTIGIAEKRLTAHYEGTVLNNWVDK